MSAQIKSKILQMNTSMDQKDFSKEKLASHLKVISNNELVVRMEKLVRTERKITHLILLHIAEIEDRKIYAEMGYDGMYTYLTRGLGYSEGAAYRRLQSARLLKQIPSVAGKIETGHLNLTQLTQVQRGIKETSKNGAKFSAEKTLEVLNKLENKNTFETLKIVSLEMNLPVQSHEKVKPQADDSIRIELTLTAEQFQELEKAKNLLSHVCPEGSWAEVISTLAKQFNQKKLSNKPLQNNSKENKASATQSVIATRVEEGSKKFNKLGDKPMMTSASQVHSEKNKQAKKNRRYISIHKKRDLLKKANYCCEYLDPKTKKRCSSKFLLEVDHIRPVAHGGTDEICNLRILCRTHNALASRQKGLGWNEVRM